MTSIMVAPALVILAGAVPAALVLRYLARNGRRLARDFAYLFTLD